MKKTPRGRAALCVIGMILCLATVVGVMYVMVNPVATGRMFSGAYWGVADWIAEIAYPLLVELLLCMAFAACLRVVAEALYCLVNDRRGVPYGIGMLVASIVASVGMAACASGMLSFGIRYGFAPLAVAIVIAILVARCVSRHTDITSLSVDATRHGMIPYQPYELASKRAFPLGILPSYRSMRRSVRRMQSVGAQHETFLAIGNDREAAAVVNALPAGSPLGTFVAKVVSGMPDNDVRYPFGIGRMIGTDGKKFAIANAKKLAHTQNMVVVPAAEFCATLRDYSWLVRQTFVMRNADGTVQQRRSALSAATHEKGKVLQMPDGTSMILPPDKSNVIPIDQSTVVPVIKTDDAGNTGFIHADVSDLVDVDGEKKAKHGSKRKQGTKRTSKRTSKAEKPSEDEDANAKTPAEAEPDQKAKDTEIPAES